MKINIFKKTNLPLVLMICSVPPIVFSLLKEFGFNRDELVFFFFFIGCVLCYLLSFLIALAEFGFVLYYVFSGGSFWNREIRLRRKRPYSGLKLDFLALLIWGISVFLMTCPGWLPVLKNASQGKLISYFEKNKDAFNSIAQSVLSATGQPEKQLMQLGFCGECENRAGVVYLYLYREDHGPVGGGYHEGFAFSEKELTPQVENIDKDAQYCKVVYHPMDKNWYLFYSFY